MKKSLIALAVAGLVAAPAFADTSAVDVYGKVRVSLDYIDADGADAIWTLNDQASRIGFKGTEDLGGGLKAVWQIESGFTAANAKSGTIGSRNTFVGLAGGFGTFVMGRHDTPYKLAGSADLFADTAADSQGAHGIIGGNNAAGSLGFDLRVDNAVAYISPTFSGFHVAAAIVPAGEDLNDAYSLAAVYANGPLNVSAAFEDHNNLADEDAWKVNVGYTMGDFKVGVTYEDQDLAGGADEQAWLVSGAYNMGPITLAAQYGNRDNADEDMYVVGVIYNMSKRTNVSLAYVNDEVAGAEADAISFQMNHSF